MKETLRSILVERHKFPQQLEAYIEVTGNFPFETMSRRLSELLDLVFEKGTDFDECEAYVAPLDNHEMILLQSPEDITNNQFGLTIEPASHSTADGQFVDVSNELTEWLRLNAGSIGQFKSSRDQ